MKNTQTSKGFKVIMALVGLISMYGALFFYGDRAPMVPLAIRYAPLSSATSIDNGIDRYRTLIIEASRTNDVPPALVAAIIHAESNFNPKAVSPVGARGLMQINYVTQRHLGVSNVFNPRENVHGGARYLRELLDSNRGNMRLAIASYNAGPGAVRKFGGIPPYRETRNYVVKVMNLFAEYRREFRNKLILTDNAHNQSTPSS